MTQITPAAASQAFRAMREPNLRVEESASLTPLIQVHNLEKTYQTARGALTLFHGLDLNRGNW